LYVVESLRRGSAYALSNGRVVSPMAMYCAARGADRVNVGQAPVVHACGDEVAVLLPAADLLAPDDELLLRGGLLLGTGKSGCDEGRHTRKTREGIQELSAKIGRIVARSTGAAGSGRQAMLVNFSPSLAHKSAASRLNGAAPPAPRAARTPASRRWPGRGPRSWAEAARSESFGARALTDFKNDPLYTVAGDDESNHKYPLDLANQEGMLAMPTDKTQHP
jgi:hypothetical protein